MIPAVATIETFGNGQVMVKIDASPRFRLSHLLNQREAKDPKVFLARMMSVFRLSYTAVKEVRHEV